MVEDDDELWMTQRVHQRGACILKVSGRDHRPARGLPRPARAVVGRAGARAVLARARPGQPSPAGARGARAARLHAARRAAESLRADAWAAPEPGALAVMARVKERFDPARIFRPGAFVGGI